MEEKAASKVIRCGQDKALFPRLVLLVTLPLQVEPIYHFLMIRQRIITVGDVLAKIYDITGNSESLGKGKLLQFFFNQFSLFGIPFFLGNSLVGSTHPLEKWRYNFIYRILTKVKQFIINFIQHISDY